MKTYLVGGAVRDMLLGLESKDRDYVVVGSNEEEMLALGYSKVGASFPVFLHPETGDQYALARTEHKTGNGYNGFKCYTDNINPELLQKFVVLGYSPDIDYDIHDLAEQLRRINQLA